MISQREIVPGSAVVHTKYDNSFGIVIGVHGQRADVLWTVPPVFDENTVKMTVKVPIFKPVEYITFTFKIDPEGIPDDVA